jgi:hypothetical protein
VNGTAGDMGAAGGTSGRAGSGAGGAITAGTGGAPGGTGSAGAGTGGASPTGGGGSTAGAGAVTTVDGGASDAAAPLSGVTINIGGMAVPKEKVIVFVHVGHSNMAGRATDPATLHDFNYTTAPHLLVLCEGGRLEARRQAAVA